MNEIRSIIVNRHTDDGVVDNEQLDAVFSTQNFLVVEAPAGYGKTKTMISKIAYSLATSQVPYPKKILALTFSINAAFNIRNELNKQLPQIFSKSNLLSKEVIKSVYATNYHGLCRRILKNYGFLINERLCRIDQLRGIGINIYDNESFTYQKFNNILLKWGINLSREEINLLISFTKSIKDAGKTNNRQTAIIYIQKNLSQYLKIIEEKFLSKSFITFDAILLFTRQLFWEQTFIRNFYRDFFPILFVDEFQDTNILQWSVLQDLIGRDQESPNKVILFGDQHQKIYEFLGALDQIIELVSKNYDTSIIKLITNHRFKSNKKLLDFDEKLRGISENLIISKNSENIPIDLFESKDQETEGLLIVEKIFNLISNDSDCSIAILTRAGKENTNTQKLIEVFNSQKDNGFSFFYALYSDEDLEYLDFHKMALASLYEHISEYRNFSEIEQKIQKDLQIENPSDCWISLLILLETFFKRINIEYRFLKADEKIDLVIDTLKNNALKQYLMYVKNSQVILSTIHGSKGLEWDYVFLPDMEKNSFPSYPGLCKACNMPQDCQHNWNNIFKDKESEFFKLFKEEINVFYVGGTRARKSVFFTFSNEGFNSRGESRSNILSCFLKIDGFQINRSM